MNISEINEALSAARAEIRRGDNAVREALILIGGHSRLRPATERCLNYSNEVRALCALKHELKDFNATTRKWSK